MNSNTSQRTWVSSVTISLPSPLSLLHTPATFSCFILMLHPSLFLFLDHRRTPDLGEIVFHLGTQDTVATMAWHYHEPRTITNLKILPVPFSITTEDDVPVDIKVHCVQLQSINQSFTQAVNQSINQSIHQSINLYQSINQSINPSINQFLSIN